MRTIKFRAFEKQINKMWSWEELQQCLDSFRPAIYFRSLMLGELKDKFTLLQYTGLKDENGVEIYEGDVIMNDSDIGLSLIEWVQSSVGDDWGNVNSYIGFNFPPNAKNFRVVGNIYQNPELNKKIWGQQQP